MKNQIFLIGLPRSGSTLLSKILNMTPDILSINDLYYVQTVQAADAINGKLTPNQAADLADWIFDLAWERSFTNNDFVGQFKLKKKDIFHIRKNIIALHQKNPLNWAELMDVVLSRLANKAGKTRWADKTPQNFMHIELLYKNLPEAAFLFLFRDPRHILASYKYIEGGGHDKRQYHPFFYALYWRTAVRKYFQVRNKISDIEMIRYEDLISNFKKTTRQLNSFLLTQIQPVDPNTIGSNTSFQSRKKKSINPTEKWICQKICASEMKALNYELDKVKPLWKDLPDLILTSIRFMGFQVSRFVFSKDGRKRILSLITQILSQTK